MIVAFSFSAHRIAPVFDTTRQLTILTIESDKAVQESEITFPQGSQTQKALQLSESGVDALVCGAISKQLQELVEGYGIKVTAFIAGNRDEIIQAWMENKLSSSHYKMPGCCGQHRGAGRGMRRGRGSQIGHGRQAEIHQELCICPNCGSKQPHQRGVPCMDMICPSCGSPLVRMI